MSTECTDNKEIEAAYSVVDEFEPEEVELHGQYRMLFKEKLKRVEEIGLTIPEYNGAIRLDTIKGRGSHIVKHPGRFLNVIRFLKHLLNVNPSHGIQIKPRSEPATIIHLIVEFDTGNNVGVIFNDSKRPLSVKQVFVAEKAVKFANLTGLIIITNKVGIPAMENIEMINEENGETGIFQLIRYAEIKSTMQKLQN